MPSLFEIALLQYNDDGDNDGEDNDYDTDESNESDYVSAWTRLKFNRISLKLFQTFFNRPLKKYHQLASTFLKKRQSIEYHLSCAYF